MSISKVNSKFKIIRKPDYTRKDSNSSIKVEVSNKESGLNNNLFNDLVFNEKENDKNKKPKKEIKKTRETLQQKESDTSEVNEIRSTTDFYI